MLIRVDTRIGSRHLAEPLTQMLSRQATRFRVESTKMTFADVAWAGEGPEDKPIVNVGVELKDISDLLNSLESRRLIEHQLPGLADRYDVPWLVIQGRWSPALRRTADRVLFNDKHGYLRILAGMAGRRGWLGTRWRESGWRYDNLIQILCGLCYRFNIRVWRTEDKDETLWWLTANAIWWSKPWKEHRSGEAWSGTNAFGATAKLRVPSDCEKVAAILNGVGEKRARWVAKHFGSIYNMVTAKPEEWVGIRQPGVTKTGRRHPGFTVTSAMLIQKQLQLLGKGKG